MLPTDTERNMHTDCKGGPTGGLFTLGCQLLFVYFYVCISRDKVIIGCDGVGSKGDMTRWDVIPRYTSLHCQYNEACFSYFCYFFILLVR